MKTLLSVLFCIVFALWLPLDARYHVHKKHHDFSKLMSLISKSDSSSKVRTLLNKKKFTQEELMSAYYEADNMATLRKNQAGLEDEKLSLKNIASRIFAGGIISAALWLFGVPLLTANYLLLALGAYKIAILPLSISVLIGGVVWHLFRRTTKHPRQQKYIDKHLALQLQNALEIKDLLYAVTQDL